MNSTAQAMHYVAIAILALITLTIGFYPEPFITFSIGAAEQLTDSSQYINAVSGGSYAPD